MTIDHINSILAGLFHLILLFSVPVVALRYLFKLIYDIS